MSGGKINLFVNMGMGGRGTSTFQVNPSMKVEDFIQMVIDKEGAIGVRIITMGKQLEATRNGRTMTLADYGVYNNLNMHAALRLKGGAAEGPSVSQHFDIKEVETLGATVVCNPQNPNGAKGDCIFGRSDGCYEDNVTKAKLGCGCILCADCMKWHIDEQLMGNNPSVVIVCGDTSHGKQIDIALGYAVSGLTPNERNIRNNKLAEHAFVRPDSLIKYCPVGKCKQFVFRENSNSSRIECGVCHQFMCWKCCKEYKGKQDGHCGNEHCDDAAYLTLHLCEAKEKEIYGVKVTDTRICTNKKCCAVNIHGTDCKHMTCKKCAHQYCHICLQDWTGHQSSLCKVAPEQKITADMKYSE